MTTAKTSARVNIIGDPFDYAEELIAQGERDQAYEMAKEIGTTARENRDWHKWRIGDAALLVIGAYGENAVGKFAEDINEKIGQVREYRTVCRFWHRKNSARAEILDTCGLITYSHFRDTMRFSRVADDLDEARRLAANFLRECQDREWKTTRAAKELAKRIGAPEPAEKILDAIFDLNYRGGAIALPPDIDIARIAARDGELIRMAIWVEDEQ